MTPTFPESARIDAYDDTSVRGRFVVTHDLLGVPAARAFATMTDSVTRRRWLRLPGTELSRSHDIRPGGEERVTSRLVLGERQELVEHRSTFLAIDAPTRVQTAYVAIVDDVPRWSSLVDVSLEDADDGCRLTWSESFLFAALSGDGGDDVFHLVGGTRLRLNALAALLDERPPT
jgi:uncharacterized protein YndB with AHSA1/START domain